MIIVALVYRLIIVIKSVCRRIISLCCEVQHAQSALAIAYLDIPYAQAQYSSCSRHAEAAKQKHELTRYEERWVTRYGPLISVASPGFPETHPFPVRRGFEELRVQPSVCDTYDGCTMSELTCHLAHRHLIAVQPRWEYILEARGRRARAHPTRMFGLESRYIAKSGT